MGHPIRQPVRLETARLILREWEPDDWYALRPIATDPDVMRYIGVGRPWSDDQIRMFVDRQIRQARELGFCLWALIAKDRGALIGHAGIQPLGKTKETEIGWWLAKDRWGKGLATEAATRALRFAFADAKLERVVAIAHPRNTASIGVMKKIGMQLDKMVRPADLAVNGPDLEIVMYAITKPRAAD